MFSKKDKSLLSKISNCEQHFHLCPNLKSPTNFFKQNKIRWVRDEVFLHKIGREIHNFLHESAMEYLNNIFYSIYIWVNIVTLYDNLLLLLEFKNIFSKYICRSFPTYYKI